jgi:hypothetical protein
MKTEIYLPPKLQGQFASPIAGALYWEHLAKTAIVLSVREISSPKKLCRTS